MCGAPLGDDDVAGLLDDGDAVRVEQLPVSLPALPKLKLEAALAVEDLEKGRYLKDLKFVKTRFPRFLLAVRSYASQWMISLRSEGQEER